MVYLSDILLYMSTLFNFFVSSLSYCKVLYSTAHFEVHCYMFAFEINIYMYQTSIFGLKIKFALKIARNP